MINDSDRDAEISCFLFSTFPAVSYSVLSAFAGREKDDCGKFSVPTTFSELLPYFKAHSVKAHYPTRLKSHDKLHPSKHISYIIKIGKDYDWDHEGGLGQIEVWRLTPASQFSRLAKNLRLSQ